MMLTKETSRGNHFFQRLGFNYSKFTAWIFLIFRWNPFRISRDEAEKLLQGSYAGAFIFSHSVTSEAFLSMRYRE